MGTNSSKTVIKESIVLSSKKFDSNNSKTSFSSQ